MKAPEGQGQGLQLSAGKSIPRGGRSQSESPEAWFAAGSSGAGDRAEQQVVGDLVLPQ